MRTKCALGNARETYALSRPRADCRSCNCVGAAHRRRVCRDQLPGRADRDVRSDTRAADPGNVPPVVVAGALASVRYLKTNNDERVIARKNAETLKSMLREAQLPVMHTDSHIVPLLVGNAKMCKVKAVIWMSQ